MLPNAYFLAKFHFDTAENGPAKKLQNFRKMHFRKMHFFKLVPSERPTCWAIRSAAREEDSEAAAHSGRDLREGGPRRADGPGNGRPQSAPRRAGGRGLS